MSRTPAVLLAALALAAVVRAQQAPDAPSAKRAALPAGAMAGIVVAAVVVLAGAGVGTWYALRRRARRPVEHSTPSPAKHMISLPHGPVSQTGRPVSMSSTLGSDEEKSDFKTLDVNRLSYGTSGSDSSRGPSPQPGAVADSVKQARRRSASISDKLPRLQRRISDASLTPAATTLRQLGRKLSSSSVTDGIRALRDEIKSAGNSSADRDALPLTSSDSRRGSDAGHGADFFAAPSTFVDGLSHEFNYIPTIVSAAPPTQLELARAELGQGLRRSGSTGTARSSTRRPVPRWEPEVDGRPF